MSIYMKEFAFKINGAEYKCAVEEIEAGKRKLTPKYVRAKHRSRRNKLRGNSFQNGNSCKHINNALREELAMKW